MLILAAAIVILGIALLIVGLRGRRIDDHPLCSACGFDLTGTLPTGQICPECGGEVAAISPEHPRGKAIRIGHRRKRPGILLVGALSLALGLGLTSYGVWAVLNQGTLNSHKPTWWLLLDIRGASVPDVDAALVELKARHDAGTLGKDQLLAIVELGLTRQADPNTPWLPRWGELIETAWRANALTPEQRTRYARNALGINLLARSEVRRGDILPLSVELDSRVGPGNFFAFRLSMTDIALGTQALEPRRFAARGEVVSPISAPATRQRMDIAPSISASQDYERDSRIEASPGKHTVSAKLHLTITEFDPNSRGMTWSQAYGPDVLGHPFNPFGAPSKAPVLAERDGQSTADVTIVDQNTQDIELVKDPALANSVRNAISIHIAAEPHGTQPHELMTYMWFSTNSLPVDIAFKATIRASDGSEDVFPVRSSIDLARGSSMGFNLGSSEHRPGDTLDVILTPDPEAARLTVDLKKIWGEEIVFKCIVVQGAPPRAGAPIVPPPASPGTDP